MKRLLLWVAVPLLLLGAAMLIADIGATALWIAVIAVGVSGHVVCTPFGSVRCACSGSSW